MQSGAPMTPASANCFGLRPRLVEAELEVQEMQNAGRLGAVPHGDGLVGVASERLVAQHRMAVIDRAHHVVEMHEGRRVHRDEVDVRRQCTLSQPTSSRGLITSTSKPRLLVDGRGRVLAEPGTDDRDLHVNSPVSPVPPTLRVS